MRRLIQYLYNTIRSLQLIIPPKRFDVSPPDWRMLRRFRCAQIFLQILSGTTGDVCLVREYSISKVTRKERAHTFANFAKAYKLCKLFARGRVDIFISSLIVVPYFSSVIGFFQTPKCGGANPTGSWAGQISTAIPGIRDSIV